MDTQVALVILVLACAFYLFPTFVAACRGHHNTMAIFVLNLLLGWTLLGWVVALVWACTASRRLLVGK